MKFLLSVVVYWAAVFVVVQGYRVNCWSRGLVFVLFGIIDQELCLFVSCAIFFQNKASPLTVCNMVVRMGVGGRWGCRDCAMVMYGWCCWWCEGKWWYEVLLDI
ncbi:hypothetical protein HanRHA438_Chr14g0661621 [Helianthus annuus]|nr:hypothetical protein HanRHA438_Chr14g0661621 [Helianthus annuus]